MPWKGMRDELPLTGERATRQQPNPYKCSHAFVVFSIGSVDVLRALGATLMVPGNVYNFGASMPALLHENTDQAARTCKGQISIAVEQRLQHSGVRSIVIRAGDFFGSGRGTWFDTTMVKDLRKGVFTYPGAPEVPSAWAYLLDLVRSFVAVAQRRAKLPAFEVLHFAGQHITGQRCWMCWPRWPNRRVGSNPLHRCPRPRRPRW